MSAVQYKDTVNITVDHVIGQFDMTDAVAEELLFEYSYLRDGEVVTHNLLHATGPGIRRPRALIAPQENQSLSVTRSM